MSACATQELATVRLGASFRRPLSTSQKRHAYYYLHRTLRAVASDPWSSKWGAPMGRPHQPPRRLVYPWVSSDGSRRIVLLLFRGTNGARPTSERGRWFWLRVSQAMASASGPLPVAAAWQRGLTLNAGRSTQRGPHKLVAVITHDKYSDGAAHGRGHVPHPDAGLAAAPGRASSSSSEKYKNEEGEERDGALNQLNAGDPAAAGRQAGRPASHRGARRLLRRRGPRTIASPRRTSTDPLQGCVVRDAHRTSRRSSRTRRRAGAAESRPS